MRALTLALILHFTLNPLVFLRGRLSLRHYKPLLNLWTIIFASELLLYITVFLFYRILPPSLVQFGRVLGTSWMLFIIYLGVIFFLFDFFYLVFKRQLNKPRLIVGQPHKMGLIIFSTILIIIISILSYGRFEFKNPSVNNININIDKNGNKYDSLRVLVVGDMHLGYTINYNDANRMVNLIMDQKADLILMIGDIIDSSLEPLLEQNVGNILKRLHAPLGVYSCPGNHEYRLEAEEKIKFLNDAGITILRDTAIMVDSSFYIIGREDWVMDSRLSTKQILQDNNVDMSKPVFLLNHSPYDLSEDTNAKVDIALFGHTHHGQSFPGNIATNMKFEVAYGYKKKDNTNIYVTSGIGLAGPQHRIGTKSEVAILHITFNK